MISSRKGCEPVKTETQLAKLIRITKDKARYDNQVKKLLANQAILAWILKTCTEEFAPYRIQEIESCIQGDPEISLGAVHPNDTDRDGPLLDGDVFQEGMNTEDGSFREENIYYDIRVNARAPSDGIPIELIINIEVQLNPSPGYPIEKRAVYYCSCLISSQYGTVFAHSEYQKLRKVYSIWFCTDPPRKRKNTIKKISLKETPVFGQPDTSGKDSDLMQILIINLGDAEGSVENQILRLMNVLLSTKTDVREKQRVMQEEFHIAMTTELEVEVEELCNLSQGIYNEGFETGIEKGIQGAVAILREEGYRDQQIIERIQKRYGLTLEEAEKYVIVQV